MASHKDTVKAVKMKNRSLTAEQILPVLTPLGDHNRPLSPVGGFSRILK